MNETIPLLQNRLNTVWKEIDKVSGIIFKEIRESPPYSYINWKRPFGGKIFTFSWSYPIYLILREYDNSEKKLKRVVIDLPPFFEEISREQSIIFFDKLSKIAYGLNLLVVVTCRTRDSSLEQLAPIVINMNRKILNDGRAVSTISIKKNVGSPSSPSEYEFEIRGLELQNKLDYKLEGIVFNEKKTPKPGYEPYKDPIYGIWVYETSFKVGEKIYE